MVEDRFNRLGGCTGVGKLPCPLEEVLDDERDVGGQEVVLAHGRRRAVVVREGGSRTASASSIERNKRARAKTGVCGYWFMTTLPFDTLVTLPRHIAVDWPPRWTRAGRQSEGTAQPLRGLSAGNRPPAAVRDLWELKSAADHG